MVIHSFVFPALCLWAERKGRNSVGTKPRCAERNRWERGKEIVATGGFSSKSLPKSIRGTYRISIAVLPLVLIVSFIWSQ